jgi:hypothetical protein
LSSKSELPQIEVVAEYELRYFNKPVLVVKAKNNHLYAILLSLCAIFGLNEIIETERIQTHTVLQKMLAKTSICGLPNLRCLRVDYIATWLLNIPLENLSNPTEKKELATFQQNAAQVLEEAYRAGRLTEPLLITELLEYDSDVGNAYREALAVLGLAREQLLWEGKSNIIYHQSPKSTEPPC